MSLWMSWSWLGCRNCGEPDEPAPLPTAKIGSSSCTGLTIMMAVIAAAAAAATKTEEDIACYLGQGLQGNASQGDTRIQKQESPQCTVKCCGHAHIATTATIYPESLVASESLRGRRPRSEVFPHCIFPHKARSIHISTLSLQAWPFGWSRGNRRRWLPWRCSILKFYRKGCEDL